MIKVDAIRDVVADFKRDHKCKRVFLAGEAGFVEKCRSFCESLIKQGCAHNGGDEVLVLKDEVIWKKGDLPAEVTIGLDDVIAVFDNTELGFFGNIAKSACKFGALVTTKGFVTLNDHTEGLPSFSGFLSWRALLVGNRAGSSFAPDQAMAFLFTDEEYGDDPYPIGGARAFYFSNSKLNETDLIDLIVALKNVVKGDK